jgi:DNA (cytosine-5)-methyltransferase 1
MKVISLFSGAGGLDLGLEAAGFDIAVCIENDPVAKQTLRHNRPQWKLMEPGDIYFHSPQEILNTARIRPREAYVLSAGPPCQPFSKAAMWVNGQIPGYWDARARTLKAMMRVIAAALPRFIILENVEALIRPSKDSGFRMLRRGIDKINKLHRTEYRWNSLRLNAADYGVPQIRHRLFLIADR